ncbi:tetratricopeptide repeat protein [Pedobacter cryoconitis]|uniref:Tetratricopeptide repeat protein n=1 Tax=Pedobacter cryoconitis TaxID=188932 RepID=A0A327SMU4_9SPHI|nr:hypothetical protein [Pedobacter cryoconitis]RAJ29104.1 hypothetical protein LY11_02996 [Pedobacter cryoconitis]
MKTILKTAVISTLIFFLSSISVYAGNSLGDKIKSAVNSSPHSAETQIEKLITSYIWMAKEENLSGNREILLSVITKSDLPDKKAFSYEIEALYAKRLLKFEQAKRYIIKALDETPQENPRFIRLLRILAFIDTDLENYMRAMESYLIIEKQLQNLQDTNKLILNYTNIADLYIKSSLYQEAIAALDTAHHLAVQQGKAQIQLLVYENKATAYFHLNNLDSLSYYADKVAKSPAQSANSGNMYRLRYMILLLKKDKRSIDEIKTLIDKADDPEKLYTYLHLAQAYLLFDQTEKAREIALILLSSGDLKNLGHMRCKLFNIVGDAFIKDKKFALAAQYYKKATDQAAVNTVRTMKTGSILNYLKYDEIKKKYVVAQEDLQVRQNYFMLCMAVAGMIILAFIFLYRSLKMKKKYDELMFNKLNSEISFINSHEIRGYLSNILGIIMVIRMSEDRKETYLEFEQALFDSAENLDHSIQNIAKKLNDKAESC